MNIQQVIEANKTHGKPLVISGTFSKALTSKSRFAAGSTAAAGLLSSAQADASAAAAQTKFP